MRHVLFAVCLLVGASSCVGTPKKDPRDPGTTPMIRTSSSVPEISPPSAN